ncbi:Tar ligand binding domain-containing protein, partial [Staphylococcus epidermidis]|uniref:Tar ligand binding domain-containing protein n=1 Tax=Staphylococcus epidermidis TaxID=1282 RepID=UPI0027382C4B
MGNLSLKAKLLSSYLFCAFCVAAVGVLGYWGSHRTSTTYQHVAEVNLPNSLALTQMRGSEKDMIVAVTLLPGKHASAAEVEKSKQMADTAAGKFDAAQKKYLNIPFAPGEE